LCIVLYVGSDRPLPLPEWGPAGREIGVHEATREPDVVALFSKPFVYSVGTRLTGDGCGFQGDYKGASRARQQLARLFERALERVLELEVFVAWHDFGSSGDRPTSFNWIGPSDIRTWVSGFKPNEFLLVIRED
jgi:hypothetical protein